LRAPDAASVPDDRGRAPQDDGLASRDGFGRATRQDEL